MAVSEDCYRRHNQRQTFVVGRGWHCDFAFSLFSFLRQIHTRLSIPFLGFTHFAWLHKFHYFARTKGSCFFHCIRDNQYQIPVYNTSVKLQSKEEDSTEDLLHCERNEAPIAPCTRSTGRIHHRRKLSQARVWKRSFQSAFHIRSPKTTSTSLA